MPPGTRIEVRCDLLARFRPALMDKLVVDFRISILPLSPRRSSWMRNGL